MADTNLSESVMSNEMVVRMDSRLQIAEFIGSRTTLEEEVKFPADMSWPDGFDRVNWQAGGLTYFLRRERPEGARGPRRAFRDIDWWNLRFEPSTPISLADLSIQRKEKELAEMRYCHSAKGRMERSIAWEATEMNQMMKRLEAIEAAQAARDGSGFKVFVLEAGEKEEQARERLGLTDWPGTAVFLPPGCEKL